MKIINKTKWETNDIKRLCKTIINKVGSPKNHIIEIVPNWYYTGCAKLNGKYINLKVPEPNYFKKGFDVDFFGKILEHEIYHNMGLNHDVMLNPLKINTDYLKGITIKQKGLNV